ncbi:MAG: acetylxylan esterase [Saprospiraceae bacterium]
MSKNLQILFFVNMLIVSCLTTAFSQITVQADRAIARYKTGESMSFNVTSLESGTATYEVFHDIYTEPLATGTVQLSENQTEQVSFKLDYPGSVFCKVSLGEFANYGGAAFAPEDIHALSNEPADFDQFWDNLKAESAAIPLDPQLTFLSSSEYANVYRVNLANLDGRRVYAYVSIPFGSGNAPAFITFPSFGNSANLVEPELILPERSGAISVAISVLNTEPDENDPAGYTPNDITRADGIFYKYALIGAVRMIDWLFSRPEFNKQNLGVLGVSQGGGLATMVAGLDQRVNLLAASNPSHGQNVGFEAGRATPFPYYLVTANLRDDAATAVPKTFDAIQYYDAINFAKRYKGPALMLTGYRDDVNPPETVYGIINALTEPKVIVHARDLTHLQNPDEYWLGRLDMIRRYFPETLDAPWPFTPTTTGYAVDAGEDAELANENDPLTVAGIVSLNGQNITNLPVEWRKVSGPGTVTFANANAASTAVTFSQAGEYVLSFAAYDNEIGGAAGRFYTIMDYVNVQAGDPNADNVRPTVSLSTDATEVTGEFSVTVNLSEPIQQLNKEDFTITNGTASVLTGTNLSYMLQIIPTADGNVSVRLPDNQVVDLAANGNIASNIINVNFKMPTAVEDVVQAQFAMYPNPVTSILYLKWQAETAVKRVLLINGIGQIIENRSVDRTVEQLEWNTEQLPNGIYYIIVENEKGAQFSQRLIKIKR